MAVRLTPNAIAAVEAGDLDLKPVVQVIEVRRIAGNNEKYRAWLSDGSAVKPALLATQLNELVRNERLKNGSVIQLLEYIASNVQTRRIIVVLNLEIIVLESDIIGNPNIPPECNVTLPNRSFTNNQANQILQPLNGSSARMGPNPFPKPFTNPKPQSNFQPTIQPSYKPPPNYKNQGAIEKNEAPARIIPIAALNPYQGRWAIKARVTSKGDIRRYNNAKGDGKVFSFDLLDSDGGEIRVTCFNALVDKFYEIVEVGRVYMISKGSLKPAQKNFNHLNNEWEILLESASTIEPCSDEDSYIPAQNFKFRPINEIEEIPNNSIIDIIGVVMSVNPSMTILRKNGMETQRRIVNLKDRSNKSVELTLWGEFCNREGRELQELVDSATFPVLAVKAGKVSDFNGKSIGTISSTQLFINPNIPETLILKEWFENQGGKDSAADSISRDQNVNSQPRNEIRKTVSQIKEEKLGMGDKPDWVAVKAVISFIKTDNFCYTACPLMIGDRQCNKKVTRANTGNWVCERCEREIEECDYRYLLQVQVQDHTGVTWVTAFQESGEEIIGVPAKELFRVKNEEGDESRFAEIVKGSLFEQYLLRLKIKEELYGDEQRVKITVVKADRVDPSAESRYLLETISRVLG